MSKFSVAIIGNCYFDEIYTVEKYPEPDQKVLASDLQIMLGGSATNTSCGLVELKLDSHLFTVMGSDEDAYRLFREIRNKGIKTQYINHIDGKSGRTIILLDQNKTSTKIGYQGVCSNMTNTLLLEGLTNPKFNHVHLSSTSIETINRALSYKKNQSYSLDFGAKTLRASDDEIHEALNQLNLVFFNRDIFFRLFNRSVDDLESIDVPYDIIVTAGKDGIFAKLAGKVYHQEIVPADVIDTTGAGDAVSASVIYGYLNKLDPEKLLQVAVTAASIKIESFGGSNGHASLSELKHIWE